MVANANLALAIALPVGIVALLGALVIAAWMAGRRRRDRTDPLEAAVARSASAIYPSTRHALHGTATPGSTATTSATATSKNTADTSDTASGDGDNSAASKSSRNPFKDIGLNYSKSFKRKSHAGESLWDVELDEVLDDRDWAPLEAGWREPTLQRQQQQWQHAQMRRAQGNGGYASRPFREGRNGDMPGTSSRMSSSESMVFGLAHGQAPFDSWEKDVGPNFGSYGSRQHTTRNHFSSAGSYSASATSHSSRNSGRPPPNVNGNITNRGLGSVYGGASSSTLRSLGTVPEIPRHNGIGPRHSEEDLNDASSAATAATEEIGSTRADPGTIRDELQSPEVPATTETVMSTGL